LGRYLTVTETFSYHIVIYKILLNVILENITDQNINSEVAQQVLVSLENVPQILKVKNVQYHLRGICSHAHGLNGQINDIGHYRAYCKRNGGNWELYDDQRTKCVPINSKTVVPCELLIYSI
jgi:ubiquitin C-terminal hydrolase